ncbi:MAG: AAA family ATPase, partial [Planctomycetota bacterium]
MTDAAPTVPTAVDHPLRLDWRTVTLIVSVAIALYAIRVTGPSDLMDNDQLKPAHYVHDVVLNGDWIVQTDTSGDIASKPPVQVWIASFASLPFGRAHWFTLAIPSVLGVIATALVASWFALRIMPKDPRAPLFAGLLVLFSIMGAKQVALVRTDALFGGVVALTAALAWGASRGRTNWVFVWLMGAIATLTKGPVGPLIASFGLISRPWRTGEKQRKPIAMHALGVAFFVVLVGGWVWLAYLDSGQAFFDKVIGKELVGHATASGKGDPPLVGFYKSPSYFLWWFAPASPIALVGLWTMWRSADERTRALVRFLGWWMVGGIALFSLSPHQRADLLTPIGVSLGLSRGMVSTIRDAGGRLIRYAPVGAVLEIAEQLASAGATGGILAAGAVYRLVRRDFAFDEHDEVRVATQGDTDQAIGAWRFRGPIGRTTVAPSDDELVGREDEVSTLVSLFNESSQSSRTLFVHITGDIGVGKSALAAQAIARTGATAIRAECGFGSADVPYAAVADLLRGAGGSSPESLRALIDRAVPLRRRDFVFEGLAPIFGAEVATDDGADHRVVSRALEALLAGL